MQIKLLKETIEEIGGKEAGDIFENLINNRDVNEFLIAKKVKLTINQVRNIFYKLANFGLVSFIRKKDKKKGWYTYFWTINTDKVLELISKRLEKEISSLESQLKSRETKRFYVCETCKIEIAEENALVHNFTCPECGQVYKLNEDPKIIALLKAKIAKAKRQREEIMAELSKLNEEKKKKIKKVEARERYKKKKLMQAKKLERKRNLKKNKKNSKKKRI